MWMNLPKKRIAQIFTLSHNSDIEPDQYEFYIGKSLSPTNFRRLWRFLWSKETKSSSVSITYILKKINVCQDNVKCGRSCTDEWFYFLCGIITLGKITLQHFTKNRIE